MRIPANILTRNGMMSWILVFTLTLAITEACFIRNCPTGGKRSFLAGGGAQTWGKHKCMSCGPQGLGQCVGPNICCGPSIGCYINTVEADVCAQENNNPVACEVSGANCGGRSDGHCVANGVCCSDGKCSLDSSCEDTSARDYKTGDVTSLKKPQSDYSVSEQYVLAPELEDYIRRLLRIQELNDRK